LFFSKYDLSLYPSSAPGRRDRRVDCSGDACIVGHAPGFAAGLSGPSNSGLTAGVADRRRLPPPRRPLPLLDPDLDLDPDCVLPLLLEVLCLALLSSRRSKGLYKPLLPGRSSHLCLRRSPRETLRLCSALPVDAVDKSAQNLPMDDIGAVSVACTLLPVGAGAKSACARPDLSSSSPFSGHGPVQLESVQAPLPHP
jgi:hypothetical protein